MFTYWTKFSFWVTREGVLTPNSKGEKQLHKWEQAKITEIYFNTAHKNIVHASYTGMVWI